MVFIQLESVSVEDVSPVVKSLAGKTASIVSYAPTNTLIITVDGAEVHSAEIGGQKDHEVQAKDMNEARAILDLERCEPAVSGQGGHNKAFKAAADSNASSACWCRSSRCNTSPRS